MAGAAIGALLTLGVPAAASTGQDAAAPATAGPQAPPARIVSLVPAVTETLFALGLGDRVVGVSTYCDRPSAALALPKVGTFSEPVAEAIVALGPDLVLTTPSPGNESAVRAMVRSGVRVEVVQGEGGLAEARAAMLEVARLAGADAQGKALVAAIDARIEAAKGRVAGRPKVGVAVVVGREPLVLAGPASYLGELVDLLGGRNVAAGVGGRWPRVGFEFLVQSVPQVLVDLSFSMGEASGAKGPSGPASAWARFPSLPAVKDGRVVGDPDSVLLRPGPRLGEAAEVLARALHPEAFAP